MARSSDDLCPSCGVPVPVHRRGPACPHCGLAFELLAEGPATTGYLTTFGYGVCGFITGAELGAAAALADPEIHLGDFRLTLFPVLAAVACAGLAASVGRRITFFARRGYEVLLLSGVLGGLVTFAAALVGLQSAEALVCLGVCSALVAGRAVRRFGYPRG